MNIIEFKEKVYERIISQYMANARKGSLTFKNYMFFVLNLLPFISIYIAYLLFKDDHTFINGGLPAFAMLGSFLAATVVIKHSPKILRSIINYKKESNKFWRTTLSYKPILTDKELENYLENSSVLHCKKEYSKEEINNLVRLTSEEIKDMKEISFNWVQKNHMVEKIKSGYQLDFYNLEYLVNTSDEKKIMENKIRKEEEDVIMNNNQLLLDCIGYKNEPELEVGETVPLKQKFKHLL